MSSHHEDGLVLVSSASMASISALTLSTAAMIAGLTCSGVMDDHLGRSGASLGGERPKDQDARGLAVRSPAAMIVAERWTARTRVDLERTRRAAAAVARRETRRTGWMTALMDIIRTCRMRTRDDE
jgi:hypothetical protein